MKCAVFNLLVALLAMGGCVVGCSARPQPESLGLAAGSVPEDLTIDLTVLSGDPDQAIAPVHHRTSRYVLHAGGDLLAARDPDLTPADAPRWVRVVDAPTMEAFWEQIIAPIVREHRDDDAAIGNPRFVTAQRGQITYIVEITVDGRRLQIGRTRAVGDLAAANSSWSPEPEGSISRLSRALAWLAWASDEPDQDVLRIPRRYDFGPDPYERYRRPDDGR